jgi:hypothetical protein
VVRLASLAVVVVGLSLAPSVASADEVTGRPRLGKFGKKGTGFGLGVSVGDPMGVSVKYFLHPAHAISGHLAWGLLHHGDGLAEIDYHWHSRPIGDSPIVDAYVYVGGGVGVAVWAREGPASLQGHDRPGNGGGGAGLILRAPALGLAYHWTTVPIDTSIELAWAPYLALPDLRHLDASIKVRYFF